MLIELFKKGINNSLKEIQENTAIQVEVLKELPENTAKQVEILKEETQENLKELQENTTKQVMFCFLFVLFYPTSANKETACAFV